MGMSLAIYHAWLFVRFAHQNDSIDTIITMVLCVCVYRNEIWFPSNLVIHYKFRGIIQWAFGILLVIHRICHNKRLLITHHNIFHKNWSLRPQYIWAYLDGLFSFLIGQKLSSFCPPSLFSLYLISSRCVLLIIYVGDYCSMKMFKESIDWE